MVADFSTSTVLRAVSDEILGFKFGLPDRPSEGALACLLPILRKTSHVRQYVTYGETDAVLVTDSGSISRLNVQNAGKDNVFLRSGTIFDGKGTQSRALTRSAILFPGKSAALDVRCVHQSHGIRSGSGFTYGGVTPYSVDSAFYTAGYTPRDQRTMWNSVSETTRTMASMTGSYYVGEDADLQPRRLSRDQSSARPPRRPLRPQVGGLRASAGAPARRELFSAAAAPGIGADNLKAGFDDFARTFEEILSKARLHDDQCGIALITDTGCKTVELFDVPASWEALHKDAVKRMGTELLRGRDESNVFEYKPENAVAAVRKVLALDFEQNLIFEHKPANGEPGVRIVGLTSGRYVGESVEMDGRVMHLVILEAAA